MNLGRDSWSGNHDRVRQLVYAGTRVQVCARLCNLDLGEEGRSRMEDFRGTKIEVLRDGDWYVARCLDVEIASQGRTADEARANLAEALELLLENDR